MSPARKRKAVEHVGKVLEVSQRRVCKVLGVSRTTARYEPIVPADEKHLTDELARLKLQHPDWGYKKMTQLLKTLGWKVNHKRVWRLWRQHAWQVPTAKVRKKKAPGVTDNACHIRCATKGNQVWAVDLVEDSTSDGRKLRFLTVLDEYTREGLEIEVARKMGAKLVREVLTRLMRQRGVPQFIRSDNGAEFTATLVQNALKAMGSESAFIAPGSPWQNGKNERFNGILSQELLSKELWGNVLEAKIISKQWLHTYNHIRPHGSLGMMTPCQYARQAKHKGSWFSLSIGTD